MGIDTETGAGRRPLTTWRACAVVIVHVLVGMPAGTAMLMAHRELFMQRGPIDFSELLLGIALAPLFALFASVIFLPLLLMPMCGGIAAIVAHSSLGRYRWWTAAILGVAVGVGFCLAAGASALRHPGAREFAEALVASCVVAMLACHPATNAILGRGPRPAA